MERVGDEDGDGAGPYRQPQTTVLPYTGCGVEIKDNEYLKKIVKQIIIYGIAGIRSNPKKLEEEVITQDDIDFVLTNDTILDKYANIVSKYYKHALETNEGLKAPFWNRETDSIKRIFTKKNRLKNFKNIDNTIYNIITNDFANLECDKDEIDEIDGEVIKIYKYFPPYKEPAVAPTAPVKLRKRDRTSPKPNSSYVKEDRMGHDDEEESIEPPDTTVLIAKKGFMTTSFTVGDAQKIIDEVTDYRTAFSRKGFESKDIDHIVSELKKRGIIEKNENIKPKSKKAKQCGNIQKELQEIPFTVREMEKIERDICQLLGLADTLKDFKNLNILTIITQEDINNLRNKLLKYKNESINKFRNLFEIATPEHVSLNYDKNVLFDKIFKNSVTEKSMFSFDFTKDVTNLQANIQNIDVTKHIYILTLGQTTGTGIFTGYNEDNVKIVDNREDSPEVINVNDNSANILKKIFGENSIFITNSGIKSTSQSLNNQKKYSLARIFDLNMKDLDNIIEDDITTYGITKVNKELYYIDSIFANKKNLYMNRNNSKYKLITSKENKVQKCLINKIKSTIARCINNPQCVAPKRPSKQQGGTKKPKQENVTLKQIIQRFTDNIGQELFCCLNAEDLPDDTSKIRFLTDLKRAGDFNTARSAFATKAVFLTGDYMAAAYAILIGCKTVLSIKDGGVYKYNIYNPKPIQRALPIAEEPRFTPAGPSPAQTAQEIQEAASLNLANQLSQLFRDNRITPFHELLKSPDIYSIVVKLHDINEAAWRAANAYLISVATSVTRTNGGLNSDNSDNSSKKIKGGTVISKEDYIATAIDYLYEKSLEGKRDYLRELMVYISDLLSGKIKPTAKEFIMDMDLVANMKAYLDNVHIMKYGYSTPLQYTVLRFLELSNIDIDGVPFTMEGYTSWIKQQVKEYEQKKSSMKLPETAAMAMRKQEQIPLYRATPNVAAGGSDKTEKYKTELLRLYNKYIKLAKSAVPEEQLKEQLDKLGARIQRLKTKLQ